MSRFGSVEGSTLVNSFTLHHADKLADGRPFMSTCVPQGIWLELSEIEILNSVEWQHGWYRQEPAVGDDFKFQSRLTARGRMKDTITVFRVPNGEVASFKEIDVQIRPIAKGSVGGEPKGSIRDGIAYSGMSSTTVPDQGLMIGDPGTLAYIAPTKEGWPSDRTEPYLTLETYIDEDEFERLIRSMSTTATPIKHARLYMVAELFRHEVNASLSEPWYPQDYGMLLRGEDKTYGVTRARSENAHILYRPAMAAPATDHDRDSLERESLTDDSLSHGAVANPSDDRLASIDKRLKSMVTLTALGLGIVFASLFFR